MRGGRGRGAGVLPLFLYLRVPAGPRPHVGACTGVPMYRRKPLPNESCPNDFAVRMSLPNESHKERKGRRTEWQTY